MIGSVGIYALFFESSIENKIVVLESLNRIKGYIQKLISSEIQLRQIPRLSFVIDTTFEYANKIDNIIKNINKND
jgi:ribosome-binding factor A